MTSTFDLYANGDNGTGPVTVTDIVRKLTDMHIPTYCDKDPRNSTGKMKQRKPGEWCRSTVWKILTSRVYIGDWAYGKRKGKRNPTGLRNPESYWIHLVIPAIVTQEVWDRVQERMQENRRASRTRREGKPNRVYLLTGHVNCGDCGASMTGSTLGKVGKDGSEYSYYRCATSKRGEVTHVRPCKNLQYRCSVVDTAVWSWLKELLDDPAKVEHKLWQQQSEKEKEAQPLRNRLRIVDDLLAENQHQLEMLYDLYFDGQFNREMLVDRKDRLEKTQLALETERGRLLAFLQDQIVTEEEIHTVTTVSAMIHEALEMADQDFQVKRQIIEVLRVQVRLCIEEGQRVAYVHCEIQPDDRRLQLCVARQQKVGESSITN